MEEPPARNAAWRYGFVVPANYDDVGLNCGGLGVQKRNGGKCGVCGDSYTGPRNHEVGGKYATNTIVRHYMSGTLIDIKVLLSANHNGYMEFRLCPALDSTIEVTQECLNQNLLHIDGFGTQYPISQGMDLIFLRAQLPRGLSCARCVLQWRYHAGNNWGKDSETGQTCLGCGPQEEFYNCADIGITSKDNSFVASRSTTIRPNLSLIHPIIFPLILAPSSITIHRKRTTTTTELDKSILSVYSSKDLRNGINQMKKSVHCYPTNEVLKPLLGIENWCLQLCIRDCPPTLCAEERLKTRIKYRCLMSGLYIDKPELIIPEDRQLFTRLRHCNKLFEDVRTPREGVIDAVTLKTICSLARIQTIAIDKESTTKEGFRLMRKCAKIFQNYLADSDDIAAEFYHEFCHCHKAVGTMNFMAGRLPTLWFEKRRLEKSFMTPRTRRIKEIIDSSQHTQIKLITKMSSEGEQTSKEIIRINRYLEEAYENNNNQPVSFFMFTIHPTLFSRSVENIFHVSFLIKEGKAELFLDDNQLPVLRPLYTSDSQNTIKMDVDSSSSNHKSEQIHSLTQLVLSLDMEQWENLVQINMSAGIMPDIYRHTARKSTVTKTLKSSTNVPLCNPSSTHYAIYNNNDNETQQEPIFDAIQCNIKLEEDIPQQQETFLIIPDNEIEQIIIEEEQSHIDEDVLFDIMEQMLNLITQSSMDVIQSNSTQIQRTFSLDTQDVHNVLDSLMDQVHENDNTDLLPSIGTERTEVDVHTSVDEQTPMECGEQISTTTRPQTDDDIVEIKIPLNEHHSQSCTCHCHKPVSPHNDDYLLFEQALKQTRQEQQQQKLLNSNCLIQTLKRQHEELINLYQQNKNQKSFSPTKIDREQQTLKLNVHDSQMQTDVVSTNNSKASVQQKSMITSTMTSQTTNNNHITQLAIRNYSTAHDSTPGSSNSTLPHLTPRLSANTTSTTTTVTNKKSTITRKLQSLQMVNQAFPYFLHHLDY
ncbi:hypothetical protein I4U23_007913 [Adineta vaga]|nr:hypothetical protein I4U23_007913 [Adineta vaga]